MEEPSFHGFYSCFYVRSKYRSYVATKGGIISLTHALASSLAPDRIKVNCISPGWIETGDYQQLRDIDHEQHFSRRVGKPEDIAKACLYLTDKQML